MIEFENEVFIARSTREVYGFLSDPRNLSQWNYYVLRVDLTGGGNLTVGSTYHILRKNDEQDMLIAELEEDRKIVFTTFESRRATLEMTLLLEAEDGGTRLKDQWKLGAGLLVSLGRRAIQSAVAENLAKLKELLEHESVILQDGRVASLPM